MQSWRRRILATGLLTITLCCFGTPVLAAMSAASLNGTYRFVDQGSSLWKSFGGSVQDIIYSDVGTITFNGAGSCSVNYEGKEYEADFGSNVVTEFPSAGESESCTYTVSPTGQAQLKFADGDVEIFWLSANANVLLGGGGSKEVESDGTDYDSDQLVAIKEGTGLDATSMNGTYRFVSQGSSFWRFTGGGSAYVYDDIWGDAGTLTFDGAGACSVTWDEKGYEAGFSKNKVTDFLDAGGPEACTYTVSPTGQIQLTFPDGTETFWVSADTNVLLGGGGSEEIEPDGYDYDSDQLVALKAGTDLDASSLKGIYNFISQGLNFWKPTGGIFDVISGDVGTLSFNGAGTCSATWNEKEYEADFRNNIVREWPDAGGPEACTYTVSPTGQIQLIFPDGTETFWLSADTNVLLNGGGAKEIEEDGIDYSSDQFVAVKATALPCAQPASITVPVADLDGSYIVKWGASATKGATYILQEATDAEFTDAQTIYEGPDLSWTLTDQPEMTYFYRVKATHPEYADSLWRAKTIGCAVPGMALLAPVSLGFTVSEEDSTYRIAPAVDADGNYRIRWVAAATTPPDVTYVVEEATNSTYTIGLQTIYTGAETSTAVTGRTPNVTYYYRVKVQKPGYKESKWKTKAMLKVLGPEMVAAAPASITVPVADADGNYTVKWKASSTKGGVSYVLEEASDVTFADARSVYEGPALTYAATARALGTTFFYRVKATHPEYADSPWREKSIGCAVPGTALAAPASITIPASDTDGNFDISWAASATPGVTYVVQEATNGTFTLGLRDVYAGEGLTTSLTGRDAGTYYYRVKAVKQGYRDSAWKKAAGKTTVFSQSLIGSWYIPYPNGGQAKGPIVITFLDESHYMMAHDGDSVADPSGQPGIERGTYTWNPLTGTLTAHAVVDTNGEWGLNNDTMTFAVAGNGASLLIAGQISAIKVSAASSNPLIGSWYIPYPDGGQAKGPIVITFLDSANFMMAHDGDSTADPSGQPGIERGTYTWNSTTGVLTANTIVDTNGEWGLNNGSMTFAVSVDNHSIVIDNAITATRIP